MDTERLIRSATMSATLILLASTKIILKHMGVTEPTLTIISATIILAVTLGILDTRDLKTFTLFVLPMALGHSAIIIALTSYLNIHVLLATLIALTFGTLWFYMSKNAYPLMLRYMKIPI